MTVVVVVVVVATMAMMIMHCGSPDDYHHHLSYSDAAVGNASPMSVSVTVTAED